MPTERARFVVVVSRMDADDAGTTCDVVVLGPFRRRERAESRAATVRRLAAKYDEPAGTLHVAVELIRSGSMSAAEAMDRLYGGIAESPDA